MLMCVKFLQYTMNSSQYCREQELIKIILIVNDKCNMRLSYLNVKAKVSSQFIKVQYKDNIIFG